MRHGATFGMVNGNGGRAQKTAGRRARYAPWSLLLAFGLSLALPCGRTEAAPVDPSPADPDTALVADESDTAPLGTRTPLILIHGLHGNRVGSTDTIAQLNPNVFFNLRQFAPFTPLPATYKLYRFHYVSDVHTVREIAQALRNHIDALDDAGGPDSFADREIVLIGVSMGGLVARSYMNEWPHLSNNSPQFVNRLAGERVRRLITLATPHHGSPGANWQAALALSTTPAWASFFQTVDTSFWQGTANAQHPELPNRSDLRYDDFDGVFASTDCSGVGFPSCYDIPAERNDWLNALNAMTAFDHKVLAYYGYLDPTDDTRNLDPNRSALVDFITNGGGAPNTTLPSYALFGCGFIPNCSDAWWPQSLDPQGTRLLLVINLALSEGMRNAWPENDGLVTRESGSFAGHVPAGRRRFPGHDHAEIAEGRLSNNFLLLQNLVVDLLSFGHPSIQWIAEPPVEVAGGTPVPLSWRLADFTGPIAENRVHLGISSVLRSSDLKAPSNGVYAHTFAAPNVGALDAPVTYRFAAAALDNGALVVSPIAESLVRIGPAPPTVTWVTPPPASAASGGQFTVTWQVSNFADPAPLNAVGWGITRLFGQTANQAGGDGVYTTTVQVPVVSGPGTLFYTALTGNDIEFAFAPIAPVQITLP